MDSKARATSAKQRSNSAFDPLSLRHSSQNTPRRIMSQTRPSVSPLSAMNSPIRFSFAGKNRPDTMSHALASQWLTQSSVRNRLRDVRSSALGHVRHISSNVDFRCGCAMCPNVPAIYTRLTENATTFLTARAIPKARKLANFHMFLHTRRSTSSPFFSTPLLLSAMRLVLLHPIQRGTPRSHGMTGRPFRKKNSGGTGRSRNKSSLKRTNRSERSGIL